MFRELLRGFFNIIGSLEILGNIAGLTNSVRSGMHDFWFEPQNGTTPGQVFKGFGKGTYSLVQHSVQGLTHSVSSITSALGTGLAHISGDSDFAKQRSIAKGRRHAQPKNMADGIFKGGKKFANSTWDGISGIWKDPIEGAAEDGVKGAVSGLGQGVLGLFCKPLVGVMDLGSDLVSGIGNTLPSMNRSKLIHSQLAQRRLPRMFYSKMKVMKEYKYSDALIHSNLRQLAMQNNLPSSTGNSSSSSSSSSNPSSASAFRLSPNSLCFEGSFETEPNHRMELYIILGNGLLVCRWNQTKEHRLKFQAFYPWTSFFSVSNRPGTKVLIATFKLPSTPNVMSRSKTKLKGFASSKLTLSHSNSPSASVSSSVSSSFRRAVNTPNEIKLHLKSSKLADKIARKLSLHIRESTRQ